MASFSRSISRFWAVGRQGSTGWPSETGRQCGPLIWIGSWGSDVGLRRTARLGDG
jgi:hypothetical protein